MYNPNRLSGIRRKTRIRLTPQIPVAVLSDGKLTFDSRHSFAVALAKSQDHQSYLRGFCVLADRQGALANGLHGLNPPNTDNRTHPLHCRPALVKRLVKDWVQRWNKARSISELTRQAHLVAFVLFKRIKINYGKQSDGERWYIHPWRTYA
jgi:hypothetical protein